MRPVVKLKAGVKILKDENGNLELSDSNGEKAPELAQPTFEIEPKGWVKDKVTLTINYPEVEGVKKEYSYTGDGSDWQTYEDALTIEDNKMVYAKATANGKSVISSIEINNIDKDEPTIESFVSEGATADTITVKTTANDATSGIGGYQYYIDNELEADFSEADSHIFRRLTAGKEYTLKVVVRDKAGNTAEQEEIISTEAGEQPTPTESTEPSTSPSASPKPVDPNVTPEDPDKVIKYEAGGINEWLPYYDDGSNIYIISAGYAPPSSVVGNGAEMVHTNDSYVNQVHWASDPSGTGLSANDNAFWKRYIYSKSTSNVNTICCEKLLNSNYWSSFKGDKGNDAIGTPTLEMLLLAYNKRNSTNITVKTDQQNGVYPSEGSVKTNDKAFTLGLEAGCACYWLASPDNSNNNRLWCVDYGGSIGANQYDYTNLGLRPVVQLKKGTKIVDKGEYYELEYQAPETEPINPNDMGEEDIGKSVEYETTAGVNKWLPFYQEKINGKNVLYLVAYDYAPYNETYMSSSVTGLKQAQNQYAVYWQSPPSLEATAQKTNWWKKYTFSNTSNNNSKCAGSLLNASAWEAYKGKHGTEAIGSPSLEMYVEAYNRRYKAEKLTYEIGATGLTYGGEPGTKDRAFCIPDQTQCSYWWLASPYAGTTKTLPYAHYAGGFYYANTDNTNGNVVGLRPVVRLKPGVKLVKDTEGNLSLDYSEEDRSVNPGDITEADSGKSVEYKTTAGVNKWLPFYQEEIEGKNVLYLIAYDYALYNETYMSKTVTGLNLGKNQYSVYWPSPPSEDATAQATNWWKKYAFENTSNDNSKCAGSLLNASLWEAYKGDYGTEAIGSSSLEMYVEAYNNRYGNLTYGTGTTGLTYTGTPGTKDRTFCISDATQCLYCWLASPYNGVDSDNLVVVNYGGELSSAYYSNIGWSFGLRPVVRLKPGVKLVEGEDGNYELDYTEAGEKVELTEPTFKLEPNEWTKTEVTVTITYPEGEGVVKEYSYTGEDDWRPYTEALTVEENKTVYARATVNGKSVTSSIEVNNIDTDEPTIDNFEEVETTENSIEVKITASDKTSEVAGYQYYIDGDLEADFSKADSHIFRRLTGGQEYTIKVVVTDKAGNTAEQEKTIRTKGKTVIDPNVKPENPDKIIKYEAGGIEEWLPYYNDGTRQYIIANDYLPTSAKPSGLSMVTSGSYYFYWNSYPSKTYSNVSEFWRKSKYTGTKYGNSQCAAELLDTSMWSKFCGTYGKAAIGSPSLEMFCDAYNSRYGAGKLGYSSSTYGMTYSGTPGTSDRAFVITETSKSGACWLASPYNDSNYNYYAIVLVNYGGYFNNNWHYGDRGLRPVVQLKSGVKIVEGSDGNYEIDGSGCTE